MIDKVDHEEMLVDEKEALDAYFSALLSDDVNSKVADPLPMVPTTLREQKREPITTIKIPSPQPETLLVAKVEVVEAVKPIEKSKPAWGEGEFQALLFRVAGLTLAVPLVELNGIQEWDGDKLTPMPGHVDWYLGLTDYRGKNSAIIDTAKFVLPENRQKKLEGEDINKRLNRVVFIGDGDWGLACDQVAEVINVGRDDVKWRTNSASRAWLAGTVIKHMCALIDPTEFVHLLAEGMPKSEMGVESSL